MTTFITDPPVVGLSGNAARGGVPSLLELEITGRCQLACVHCYAGSGPQGGSGSMTTGDWERVIDQAAGLGIATVQFIGGEPTLDPRLPGLVRHALGAGVRAYVYSNLVHVTPGLWALFSQPGVSLGTSWYSADPARHAEVTGSRGSYARTWASIAEAVRRGIPLRAVVVDVVAGQDARAAAAGLRELGVTDVRVRPAQGIGRAAATGAAGPDVSQLCGHCGTGRAAVLPDGQLTPCVMGRWLACGDVRQTPLAELMAGPAWRDVMTLVPRHDSLRPAEAACPPASDGDDCPPASTCTACSPAY
jgi:sulfatase maturation enzyme AslB (radical SAM superfamily)